MLGKGPEGDCGNPAEPRPRESHGDENLLLRSSGGDGKNIAGLPHGWNKIVRDSRGNAAPFDFRGAPAPTKICFQTVPFDRILLALIVL